MHINASEFIGIFVHFIKPGYLERTPKLDFVGAASSRDRFNSRLACDELSRVEAAPTGVFLVTWTYLISAALNKARDFNHPR
jgi:hypothetical protein